MSIESDTAQSILRSCSLNSQPNGSMRGYIDGTIVLSGMPINATPDEVIVYREKPVYRDRKTQLQINTLGLEGGRPYVSSRLSRFAGGISSDSSPPTFST